MTLIVNNDGVGISQLVTPANTGDETASLQIRDGLDFPHSGVFKALYSAATGNYALKNGAAGSMGFNFTYAGGTSPTVAVAAGKIFRDGKYVSISALSAHALTRPSSGHFYHLVVVKADNSMDVRESSANDDIPELTDGDIPIGLVKVAHDANTATASLPTQFFTSHKTDNNLSVGYLDSNAYTPIGELSASASGLAIDGTTATIVTTPFMSLGNGATNAGELRLLEDTDNGSHYTGFKAPAAVTANTVYTLPADYPASNKVLQSTDAGVLSWETMSSGATLTGSTDNTIVTVTGANAIAGEANLTFDGNLLTLGTAATTTDVLEINADSVTDGNIIDIHADGLEGGKAINIHSNSSDSSTRRLVNIHNDHASATGVTPLYIRNDSTGDFIILESRDASATSMPIIAFNRNSDSPAADDFLGSIEFKGEDSADASNTYSTIKSKIIDVDDGQESGAIILESLHDGTLRSVLFAQGGIDTGSGTGAGSIVLNEEGQNIDTRIEGDTDANLFFCDASANKVGISTSGPTNMLQVNVTGADGSDGIQIVRDDATTAADEILGGIGFDSSDGNVPSSITEASAFIASYATEAHSTTAKGGRLKFGITVAGTADDQTSTVMANLGPPITTSNTTATGDGFNSRATTVIIGAATYAPTVEDSGTLVIFNNSGSNLTLPSINADDIYTGVQFTVFNQTGSTISAQIAVSNSATINGAAATGADDIESFKAATFVCSGNNTWIRIG